MITAIGRIVHFCLPAGTPMAGHERPAIITRPHDVDAGVPDIGLVDLTIFPAPFDLLGANMGCVGVQRGFGAGQWHAEDECPKAAREVSRG